jgi:hypothetical protein
MSEGLSNPGDWRSSRVGKVGGRYQLGMVRSFKSAVSDTGLGR